MSSEGKARHGVREILEDFINMYKNEPCVWQIKNKDYHNRDKKTAAYNKLIQQYKKIQPNANRDFIVKKINSLRTNYRKEKKKIEDSIRSGAGTDEVYVPTLWYFDLLKFLDDDQGTPRYSLCNDRCNYFVDENDSFQENETGSIESETDSRDKDDNSTKTAHASEQRPRPPKRKRNSHSSDSTDLTNEVLKSVNEHFKRPLVKEDRFDIFGKNVAMKLRDLPKEQRLLAEKIINDTLFQAEMGNLTFPQLGFHEHEFIRASSTPSPPSIQTY